MVRACRGRDLHDQVGRPAKGHALPRDAAAILKGRGGLPRGAGVSGPGRLLGLSADADGYAAAESGGQSGRDGLGGGAGGG
jgi:hypothetical protein